MASLEEGKAGVGDGRSTRHSVLRTSSGTTPGFLELFPQWLAIDASLFQDCMVTNYYIIIAIIIITIIIISIIIITLLLLLLLSLLLLLLLFIIIIIIIIIITITCCCCWTN